MSSSSASATALRERLHGSNAYNSRAAGARAWAGREARVGRRWCGAGTEERVAGGPKSFTPALPASSN